MLTFLALYGWVCWWEGRRGKVQKYSKSLQRRLQTPKQKIKRCHNDKGGRMSASHAHGIPSTDNERALRIALALTGSFLIAEVIGGVLTGSLALISDAAHMLTDTAARHRIGGDPHCPAPGRSPANLWLPPL
jgi:hypothetical protein